MFVSFVYCFSLLCGCVVLSVLVMCFLLCVCFVDYCYDSLNSFWVYCGIAALWSFLDVFVFFVCYGYACFLFVV